MKNKLRAIIALLKSRAYLDSQGEVAERKLRPGDDSHHEYELTSRWTPRRIQLWVTSFLNPRQGHETGPSIKMRQRGDRD